MASLRRLTVCLWLSVLSLLGPAVVLADGDETVLLSEVARLNNQSLLWGPYRPNLYFGVRSRIPNGLMTGLMWSRVDEYNKIQDTMRYTCEQHTGIHGYGWDEFDTRRGGVQTIHDDGNGIDMTISFVKIPGGAHGGSWAARINGVPREGAPEDVKTTILLSVTQEAEGLNSLKAAGAKEEKGFEGDVKFEGQSPALGDYSLVVTKGEGDHPTSDHEFSEHRDMDLTTVQSLEMPDELLWRAKEVLFRQLKENVDFISENYDAEQPPPPWQCYQLGNKPGSGNIHLVQKTFQGAFSFDVLFSSASAGATLTSEDLTREIATTTESFGARFSSVFSFQAPFDAAKYARFGRAMFSNLIGGIGYFHGHSMVDRSYAPEYDEDNEGFWEEAAEARARRSEKLEGPYELFTSIPSRSFFPRGFLWDEGFHLLPIADWDSDLALEVVRSWFNLMDDDGWIAREQILGPEARSKVPPEFQVQYPHYANPPTLFFIMDDFIAKLSAAANGTSAKKQQENIPAAQGLPLATAHIDNTEAGVEYLRSLYPLLRRQYDWFRRTQAGDIKSYDREAFSTKEAYRWRGRTVPHVLTSGLDDYPRPQPPHPGELHVDLLSWVGLMTRVLGRAAEVLGMPSEEIEELKNRGEAIRRNLVDLHWDEKSGAFCDATIDDFEEHKLVCHRGYVSLFPVLLGLVKVDDPRLGKVLALIADEEELWSPHGLRSLSKKDELYGTEENYWRSPVWINMNYLAIVALHDLALQDGPHKATARDLYTRLRRNIVHTVYKSWEETGFAWEQYDPDTGKGQRTQHFTGWTSLVVKIMAMPDLGGGEHVKDEL